MGYVKLHGYKPKISMEAKQSMLDTLFKQSVGKNKNLLWQVIIWLNPPPSKSGK